MDAEAQLARLGRGAAEVIPAGEFRKKLAAGRPLRVKAGFDPRPELEKEIRDHVKTRLAAHEYPRVIEFVDELPLTETGKIRRKVLREREAKSNES